MDKKRVMYIIQTLPHKDLIDFLLDRCNLNQKEHDLIYARAKECMTQEEYAEQIGYSPRNLIRIENKAFEKVSKNWSELDFLSNL